MKTCCSRNKQQKVADEAQQFESGELRFIPSPATGPWSDLRQLTAALQGLEKKSLNCLPSLARATLIRVELIKYHHGTN